MKLLLLIIAVFLLSCNSQSQKETITELDYLPVQKEGVSDEHYHKWTNILKNVYEGIKSDSGKISSADHLNIATAFIKLKEPRQRVLDQFNLAQEKNLESTAEVFPIIYKSYERISDYLSKSEYDSMLAKFKVVMENKVEEVIDLEVYANEGGYDLALVKLMMRLKERDQKYRSADEFMDEQQIIDAENITSIDSLFKEWDRYVGSSLVGNKFSSIMWLVIQHADLEHQEKYLPIIHDAVKDGELRETPLKMLLDRIHKRKYGYQIFGSQSGAMLADDETIQRIKDEYGL